MLQTDADVVFDVLMSGRRGTAAATTIAALLAFAKTIICSSLVGVGQQFVCGLDFHERLDLLCLFRGRSKR